MNKEEINTYPQVTLGNIKTTGRKLFKYGQKLSNKLSELIVKAVDDDSEEILDEIILTSKKVEDIGNVLVLLQDLIQQNVTSTMSEQIK